MNQQTIRAALLAALSAALLTACDRNQNSESARNDDLDAPRAEVGREPTESRLAQAGVDDDAGMRTGTDTAQTMGDQVDDGMITGKVKAALLADPDVSGLKIEVETEQGAVTLTGSAESQEQVNRAVEIATRTEGVRTVSNQIVVGQEREHDTSNDRS